MRRLTTTTLILIFTACAAMAQNPKAVIKEALCNDYAKTCEKLEKINEKIQSEMPYMCVLAKAVCYTMSESDDSSKLKGYVLFSDNYAKIAASPLLEKLMKSCNTSLDNLKFSIEQSAVNVVFGADSEELYSTFIPYAEKAEHKDLAQLRSKWEQRSYANVCQANTVAEYSRFLSLFPSSEYRADVEARRYTLRYNEATTTADEAVMVRFVEEFGGTADGDRVAQRLMEHRYERVTKSRNLKDMKWFAATYPDFEGLATLRQMMADIEYPTLADNKAALARFVEEYPDVKQIGEAQRRVKAFEVLEAPTLKGIFDYVLAYGYDRNYVKFQRALLLSDCKEGRIRYILTPDIRDVSLVRIVCAERLDAGLYLGYVDLEGNVAIEPAYAYDEVFGDYGTYNLRMMTEFTHDHSVAAVKSVDGKWGVIDATGKVVVPLKYMNVTIGNNHIEGFIKDAPSEYYDTAEYYCDIYDYSGKLIKHNGQTSVSADSIHYRDFVLNDGSVKWDCEYLTSRYGAAWGGENYNVLVDRDGNKTTLDVVLKWGVTDNIAVVERVENGAMNRYFYNLDTQTIIKECPYEIVNEMHCGRAAVYANDLWGFIDENLELVIPCKFIAQAPNFSAGAAVVGSYDVGYNLIDVNGNYITGRYKYIQPHSMSNEESYNTPGLFIVEGNGFTEVIDSNGEFVVTGGTNTTINGFIVTSDVDFNTKRFSPLYFQVMQNELKR